MQSSIEDYALGSDGTFLLEPDPDPSSAILECGGEGAPLSSRLYSMKAALVPNPDGFTFVYLGLPVSNCDRDARFSSARYVRLAP